MKIVWHIFKKDLRRLWLPVVIWGAVIVMQFLAWHYASARRMNGFSAEQGPVNAVMVLWGLHLLAAWLLVPQLLHDDPLVSDNAGWRARPISGARLLAAKLLGMALLLWLWPSLLTIPWWIKFGFGPGEILRAMAVNMLGMALLTGLAAMVAVLTDSFARFVAWSIVLVVGASLAGLMLVAGMPLNGDGPVSGAVLITRASLAMGLVLVAVAVVVPMQFLRRRTGLVRGIAAGTALAVALIVQAWPWSAAQMLAKTGLKRYSLPNVSARVGETTLVVPSGEGKQKAKVRVAAKFDLKGLAVGDFTEWSIAEPRWRIGAGRGPDLPVSFHGWGKAESMAAALAYGEARGGDQPDGVVWDTELSGQAAPQLRDGGAAVSARIQGAIWRGELGPSVAVKTGAGASRGFTQLHVIAVSAPINSWNGREGRNVAWVETGALFTPTAILELMNHDGMASRRHSTALLMNGARKTTDYVQGDYDANRYYLPNERIPVGVMAIAPRWSSFDRNWWWRNDDAETYGEARFDNYVEGAMSELRPVPIEGATLVKVTFQEAAPLEVTLAETAFVPDMIVEGRLDDALRRAKAEDKLVLARVPGTSQKAEQWEFAGGWMGWPRVRELLVSRYVCVWVSPDEAARLRKRGADESVTALVVLKADGEEQDRLRDLAGAELLAALRANVAGKTHAAVLMEALAARGGDDRKLRYQVHEALRARGELAGAFDAIMWVVDHPSAPFEGTEIFLTGYRLQRLVATYGPAKAALLERRERAIANLRQDPRDIGAARMLFSITLGLKNDDTAWREFPRLMPHENPLWWEFTRNWISRSVTDKRYREVREAVDVEKFFAEGPAWVRAQLLQKRSWSAGGPPVTVVEWQKQLVRTGGNCVEALAAAGEGGAALRLAQAVLRIDSSAEARRSLASALFQRGAKAEAKQLMSEKLYAP